MRRAALILSLAAAAWPLRALGADRQGLTFQEILALPTTPADARIAYGPAPQQFGELWLPKGPGPHPVAIVIHGGCWSAEYGEAHIRPFCAALPREGVAAWCLEYRRVGDEGGGWPGTFADVARGADHLRQIAAAHRLDLGRVISVGHSAGGHLALWLAGRSRLAASDPLRGKEPLALRGVVGLAPIPDLARAASERVCGDAVPALLDGPPAARPERYAAASPIGLLPLGIPQEIVHGREDTIVPLGLSEAYVAAARAKGDAARLITVDGAGHFDVIAPTSKAWHHVEDAVEDLAHAPAPTARRDPPVGDRVGRTFLFDYGDLAIRVRYLSESRLEWEQVKGPSAGLKGSEDYEASTVRPGVYFLWWQEKDASVVTQVVDLERRRVHTTWTSPDKKLNSFQGKIVPQR
jgi:acetyl esterase/lipase